jgi:hypothetical protein
MQARITDMQTRIAHSNLPTKASGRLAWRDAVAVSEES